ncbi:MAG: polyprenyl synthetase family protein [Candidatus Melainabacteria bacterium]
MTVSSPTPIQSSAIPATGSADVFFEPVRPLLQSVRESLVAVVPPASQVLAQTVNQSLTSGGKYLRPAVVLLLGMATRADAQPEQPATPAHPLVSVAAVAEMIHIATLLHDDVLDQSDLRRGQPTVRATLGNKISVLSGDYLLAQASLKLSKLGSTRLVAIYAQVLSDLCDGEVTQMTTSFQLRPDQLEAAWAQYRLKTRCKTASLFAAAGESAGVVNALKETDIQALRRYGEHFGMAFQIVDDLLDYTASAEQMGKPVFDDVRNGLLNAPVLLMLEALADDPAARADAVLAITSLFQQEGGPAEGLLNETDAITRLQRHLAATRALESTRQLAEQAVDNALAELDFVAESPYKTALTALTRFITCRLA